MNRLKYSEILIWEIIIRWCSKTVLAKFLESFWWLSTCIYYTYQYNVDFLEWIVKFCNIFNSSSRVHPYDSSGQPDSSIEEHKEN